MGPAAGYLQLGFSERIVKCIPTVCARISISVSALFSCVIEHDEKIGISNRKHYTFASAPVL